VACERARRQPLPRCLYLPASATVICPRCSHDRRERWMIEAASTSEVTENEMSMPSKVTSFLLTALLLGLFVDGCASAPSFDVPEKLQPGSSETLALIALRAACRSTNAARQRKAPTTGPSSPPSRAVRRQREENRQAFRRSALGIGRRSMIAGATRSAPTLRYPTPFPGCCCPRSRSVRKAPLRTSPASSACTLRRRGAQGLLLSRSRNAHSRRLHGGLLLLHLD